MLEIQVDDSDGYTLCRPVGELDAYTVSEFREALGELRRRPHLLIDLSRCPFMDSAGLGALIGGIRRAREAGGEVAVACSRPTLTRLLHTTGFDRIVPVTETVESARLAALDDRPPGPLDPTGRSTRRWRCRRPTRARVAGHGEEVGGDLVEAVEVVDVGAQERHPHHRRRGDLLGQPGEVLVLRVGDERRSRPGCRRGPPRSVPARVAARSRSGLGQAVGEAGVHAVDDQGRRRGCRASASWSAKKWASATVSRRGDATRTKAVRGSSSSCEHGRGPLAEALLHALEGLEEGDGVVEHLAADHLRHRAQEGLGGHVHRLHHAPGRRRRAPGRGGGRGSG